jgi:hypothetical protein
LTRGDARSSLGYASVGCQDDAIVAIQRQEVALGGATFAVLLVPARVAAGVPSSCKPKTVLPFCAEIYNPHGENVPPAGSTTLPGPQGGENEDGFYQVGVLSGETVGSVILSDGCGDGFSGTVYGTFDGGTVVKYTEANGTTPRFEEMAGNNGQGGGASEAVDWHIWGNGDLLVCNAAQPTSCICCFVPPPPK